VNKDTWVLHGFIRDEQLRGVPNVTVALYDSERQLDPTTRLCRDLSQWLLPP
jgi:hypothetical protein